MYRQKHYNKGYKQKRKDPKPKDEKRSNQFLVEAPAVPENPFLTLRLSDLATMENPLHFLESALRQRNDLPRSANSYGWQNGTGSVIGGMRRFKSQDQAIMNDMLRAVAKKSPKMITRDSLTQLSNLAVIRPVAKLDDWRPRFKSADKNWLDFAAYYVSGHERPPAFFYSVLKTQGSHRNLLRRLGQIARGESIYRIRDDFQVPLTKRMVRHLFSDARIYGHYAQAVRTAQLKSIGASPGIIQAVNAGRLGWTISGRDTEEFWWSVLQWVVNQLTKPGDNNQVGPVFDYIQYCLEETPGFSMKGRTRRSLLRDMEVWHRNLRASGDIHQMAYRASGLKGAEYKGGRDLSSAPETKRMISVMEIRSSKELLAEGRAQNHCVYSYHNAIVSGRTSIWSMTTNGARALTIEVTGNTVIQARGKYNRPPKNWETEYLNRWAAGNGLAVRV